MRVINFSDARNQLKQVIDQVVDDADFTVIARRDAQDAVVMSLDTFNSLMETLHLMKKSCQCQAPKKFHDPISQRANQIQGLGRCGVSWFGPTQHGKTMFTNALNFVSFS